MLRPSSRDHILDIAAQIVGEQGALQLTIDAVAKAAGVSKGGVMYHFQSKDQMLAALVERVVAAALGAIQAREVAHGGKSQPFLHALIEEGLRHDPRERLLYAGLLGALANRPLLARPAAQVWADAYTRLGRMGDLAPGAMVIALALDGLLLLELLDMVHLDDVQRGTLRAALQVLADKPLFVPAVKAEKGTNATKATKAAKATKSTKGLQGPKAVRIAAGQTQASAAAAEAEGAAPSKRRTTAQRADPSALQPRPRARRRP